MHSYTYILHSCLLPFFIVSEVCLITAILHSYVWCPYFLSCPLFKFSSPGWRQRFCCPIWSGRSSPPQQSFIFKKGLVAVKSSFPHKTPALARSLHRNINLFSIFPSSTETALLLLQASHCILLPRPSPNSSVLLREDAGCTREAAGGETLHCRAASPNSSHLLHSKLSLANF